MYRKHQEQSEKERKAGNITQTSSFGNQTKRAKKKQPNTCHGRRQTLPRKHKNNVNRKQS